MTPEALSFMTKVHGFGFQISGSSLAGVDRLRRSTSKKVLNNGRLASDQGQ